MASFSRRQELATARNSNNLTDAIMLSSELNVFGGPLVVQCVEFLKQFSQTEVLRMLELRKTIAEVHIGGGRTRGRSGDQGNGRDDGPSGQLQNLLPTIVAQVGDQDRGQGDGRNQNGNAINDSIRGDVSRGCTYKEFITCNPKEYDGKGGAIVYTCWIEKMESVHDMSGCRDSHRVKYTAGSFVGKALTWWNYEIRTRGREACSGSSGPGT
ncbi:hypothetical protein Tco_1485147 [Tanacetum coccineum]